MARIHIEDRPQFKRCAVYVITHTERPGIMGKILVAFPPIGSGGICRVCMWDWSRQNTAATIQEAHNSGYGYNRTCDALAGMSFAGFTLSECDVWNSFTEQGYIVTQLC